MSNEGSGAPRMPHGVRALLADPDAVYADLRRDYPVSRVRLPFMGDAYLVSRYDDVLAVLRDDQRFVREPRHAGLRDSWLQRRLLRGLNDTMMMRDGADHHRLRTLVHKAFTPARVEALGARVSQQVDQLLDRMRAGGTADLVSGLALPLPITVICDLMGVPEEDRATFRRRVAGLANAESQGALGMLRMIFGVPSLLRYFRGLIDRRRAHRGDDLLSAMISAEEAGQRLTTDELVASTFLILFAGHETTVGLLSGGALALLDHPEQRERLRSDPSLLDAAVEELLRYTSPVQTTPPRFASQQVQLAGVTIPRGAPVIVATGSANHDERQFPEPDALDLGRSPNKHVAFGFGTHYCLGAPLARLEARVAFRALVERFPNARLAVPRAQVRWRKSMSFKGVESLPLALS